MSDGSAVRTTVNGGVLEVVLDRPKANAIDASTSQELGRVFAGFRDDPSLRVAVFTGAGDRFFSAGWDLGAAADGEEFEADYGEGGFGGFGELPRRNKPVVCAVNGLAVGGPAHRKVSRSNPSTNCSTRPISSMISRGSSSPIRWPVSSTTAIGNPRPAAA